MSVFTHLILTRFNLRTGFGGGILQDEAWHRHRFGLFDTFCYPSLRGQTNLNFKWLVFFDAETAGVFREQIDAYARWPNFVPCYVKSLGAARDEAIRAHLNPGAPYLITTRVDNDDALSVDFVATIQQRFRAQPLEFINVLNGYILDAQHARLYASQQPSNPFISLIERAENFKTVWCEKHGHVSSVGPLRQVTSAPGWVQVVHQRNASNRVRTHLPQVPCTVLAERFTLNYGGAA